MSYTMDIPYTYSPGYPKHNPGYPRHNPGYTRKIQDITDHRTTSSPFSDLSLQRLQISKCIKKILRN